MYKAIIKKLLGKPPGTYDALGNHKEIIFHGTRNVIYIVNKNGSIYRSDPKLKKTFRIYAAS